MTPSIYLLPFKYAFVYKALEHFYYCPSHHHHSLSGPLHQQHCFASTGIFDFFPSFNLFTYYWIRENLYAPHIFFFVCVRMVFCPCTYVLMFVSLYMYICTNLFVCLKFAKKRNLLTHLTITLSHMTKYIILKYEG